MRRVVVTGLGAITPLGVGKHHNSTDLAPTSKKTLGIRKTWQRLLEGHCGIVNIVDKDERYLKLPCQIAGVVPPGKQADGGWDASEWLAPGVGLASLSFLVGFCQLMSACCVLAQDDRRMALFTQYAVAAAQEALEDAGLLGNLSEEEKEAAVQCLSLYHFLSFLLTTIIALGTGELIYERGRVCV